MEQEYEDVIITIKEGDIITSKEGFLLKSPLTGKYYKCKKQQYRGNNNWLILGNKIEIEE